MDIAKEVKTGLFPQEVVENRLGAAFRPTGDDVRA
jgi:hypothetical protein